MFYGDFHLHSHFSDGGLSIPQLVDYTGRYGLGAIAITDHLCEKKSFLGQSARWLSKSLTERSFPEYMDVIAQEAERAWKVYGMLVVPGMEITKNSFSHKNSAHILAVGIREFINPDLSIEEIVAAIHEQGGIAIAAHPVDTGKKEFQTQLLWNQREILESLIDAWEVASGNILFPQVQHSHLPKIANSDMHHPRQLESWKTVFKCEKKFSSIKEAIRLQTVDFGYFHPETQKNRCRLFNNGDIHWAY